MIKGNFKYPMGRITVSPEKEGISLEEEMRKALHSNEPIQATAKITYADRKEGVLPQNDIRFDRFEYAMLATDKIHASAAAARHAMDFPDPKEIQEHTGGEA